MTLARCSVVVALAVGCGRIDPPTLTAVTLTPDPATTADDLRCTAEVAPVETAEWTVDLAFVWTVDGAAAGDGSSNSPAGGGGSFVVAGATNVATSDGSYDGATTFEGAAIENLAAWNGGAGQVVIDLVR